MQNEKHLDPSSSMLAPSVEWPYPLWPRFHCPPDGAMRWTVYEKDHRGNRSPSLRSWDSRG